ncbi:MAG: asparagine synthase (glutamine-hydrolyzing) [Gammaproteobacteria bacterium]
MCGIVAIYNYRDRAGAVDREELRAIRDYMAARGPDGKGEWYAADNRIGLGHRRLAIIDLSERGAQPMGTPDGRLTISFNGEIYNYHTLRRRLEAQGYRFRSNSDTEILLYLYAERGTAMLAELRGMFAFALWDTTKGRLFLARDPYGIKPLYYADDGRSLRAASQVKALLAGRKISRESQPAGIAGFYLFGSVPEPYTCYRDIRAVPAGSYILAGETGVSEPQRYFSVAAEFCAAEESRQPVDAEKLQHEVREALRDSVRHHCVADVPVGAFLSAGVDSGTLLGLLAELQQESGEEAHSIQTVTLGFEEFNGRPDDEAPLAEWVARYYGSRHRTRIVGKQEFRQDLPNILAAMDQPSIDGINTWYVSKAAKEQGLKVAVSGLGGDELFGGYPSFLDIPRWVHCLKLPARIPGLGEMFLKVFAAMHLHDAGCNPKIAGLLKYGGSYAGAYLLKRGLFMPWELPALIGTEAARQGLEALHPLEHIEQQALQPCPGNAFARVAALEASLYMRNQLLRDADWAGMAHSLEIRVPLVDSVLLKRLIPLLLIRTTINGKQLLASSPKKPLPQAITTRQKTGFVLPFRQWLAESPELDTWKVLPSLNKPYCHWSRRLAYTVFNGWFG